MSEFSSTNVYRNTTAADYLNQLRLQQQSDLVGNTSQTNFTPLYIITESDTINITDAVSNNGNTQTQSDSITITDSVSETDYPAGASSLAGNTFKKLWLQFNNDVLDNSTNGNNGTVTGTAIYVPAVIGNGFSFNGTSYISLGNILNFDRTQAVSIFAWIKTTSTANQAIVAKFFNVATGWVFNLTSGGLGFQIANANNTNDFTTVSSGSPSIADGLWHSVAVTYHGDSNPTNVKFYIDGVLQTTIVGRNNLSASILNSANTYVGTLDATNWICVNGTVYDDVKLWYYELSQAEINYLNAKKDGWQVEDDSSYQKLWLAFDQDYVDKSGNNNAGTLTGTEIYVPGPKTKKAFSFNGTSYISYPSTAHNPDVTSPFSVSFWLNTSAGGSNITVIVHGSGAWSASFVGYVIWIWSGDNKLKFDIGTGGVNSPIEISSSAIVNDGNWHHYVCTYDGSGNQSGMKIYVDGVLVTTGSAKAISGSSVNSNSVVIGGTYWSNLIGSLDDLQIWNYALSQSDINTLLGGQQIMHNPVVPTPAKCDFMECVA